MPEEIIPKLVEEEMKSNYLDYSMSVIISRALPDVRDGLKPVHRRILIAMNDLGLEHNKRFRKCAKICGDVSGNYHPHGESVVYPSLVRLAQDFSLRYPLVDGQGNFGSLDGDAPAAMRYTECRLRRTAEDMIQDLDKETVELVPNYDGTLKEPTVLPAKIPNLLVNGSSGIAVGMATNIPPHNMNEICEGVIQVINNPQITVKELLGTVKAPDFPTGALIVGTNAIEEAYQTGRGKLILRAKTHIEETKNRTKIIATEIPYQVNKAQLIEHIAEMVKEKKIEGISDLRDESNKEGIRIVIELKHETNPEILLNQLYKHTKLQTTYGILMLALEDKTPKILNLKEMLEQFIKHRFGIVTKRTQFELTRAEGKLHILEGLITTLDDIDNAIRLIKQSACINDAKKALISAFRLSEIQVQAVLDMKLQKLTSLEQDKMREEQRGLVQSITEYNIILADSQKVFGIIKKETEEIRERYGDNRRTQIIGMTEHLEEEDLLEAEDVAITTTHRGYIKRLPVETYKQQKRGGKGFVAAETREEDFVEQLFIANTHDTMLFFTDRGKVHGLKAYQLPEAGRHAKGTPIINLLEMEKNEAVTACIPVKEFKEGYLVMSTKKGLIKKTSLLEFSKPRKGGITAIDLEEGDRLINVKLTNGKQQLVIATQNGLAVRFNEEDVRATGRTSKGVIGIRLKSDDQVIGMEISEEDKNLFTITEKGYGKKTPIPEYRVISRGGSGVINLKITDKNGKAVAIKSISDRDELMLISRRGIAIRIPSKDISSTGRNTQGVRIIKLGEDDMVMSAAKLAQE